MAATVENHVSDGAGPAVAEATLLRFKLADNNTLDANNPCVKPAAGTNLSWWKNIRLWVAGTGASTAINNVKIYTDGALDAGGEWVSCTIYVGDETPAAYDQATTGGADTGTAMVGNRTGITGQTDFFTYTSGAVKAVSGSVGTGINQAISDYIVLQLSVGTTATGGQQDAETITWRYDET